jgi:anti-anti-sigma factor
MQIEVSGDQGTVLVAVSGRIDAYTAMEVEQRIGEALVGDRNLILDLAGTSYISSAGLRVLIALAKRSRGSSFRMVLCCLQPDVQDVMEIAGFTQLFDIAASREAAAAVLQAG